MRVVAVAASGLADVQTFGAQDPYIRCVCCATKRWARTESAAGGGTSPRWTAAASTARGGSNAAGQASHAGNACTFRVPERKWRALPSLDVELWNENALLPDELIGRAKIHCAPAAAVGQQQRLSCEVDSGGEVNVEVHVAYAGAGEDAVSDAESDVDADADADAYADADADADAGAGAGACASSEDTSSEDGVAEGISALWRNSMSFFDSTSPGTVDTVAAGAGFL